MYLQWKGFCGSHGIISCIYVRFLNIDNYTLLNYSISDYTSQHLILIRIKYDKDKDMKNSNYVYCNVELSQNVKQKQSG